MNLGRGDSHKHSILYTRLSMQENWKLTLQSEMGLSRTERPECQNIFQYAMGSRLTFFLQCRVINVMLHRD